MDQVDSLNEIIGSRPSPLHARPHSRSSSPPTQSGETMTDVVGVAVNSTHAVINTSSSSAASSPVITVAADLPSFHYFISEQAKSILALQELQNEVGALLEFRDLVIEAFPQLAHKLPPPPQPFTNALPSPTSSKWEPGIRVKRKLGQQLRDQDVVQVPSLLPRYRSNSQGKASRGSEASGSTTISSAIQDSGFCTESSKDHSSAISSRSKSRETDDELFSLLDNIHTKGTRLKLEVEYLWSRLNRKSGSYLGPGKRRCRSLDDLIVKGKSDDDDSTNTSFTYECAVKNAFLDSELLDLRRERDMLLKKMSEIESEHMANLAHTNRLLFELETISAEKRDLEERLQMAVSAETEMSGAKVNDLHNNFLTRGNDQWRSNAQTTPFAKCQLLKLMQVFKENNQNVSSVEDNNAATTINQRNDYDGSGGGGGSGAAAKVVRPTNPLMKELNDSNVYRQRAHAEDSKTWKSRTAIEYPCGESDSDGVTAATAVTAACSKSADTLANGDKDAGDCGAAAATTTTTTDHSGGGGGGGVGVVGKPDILIGFLSGHSSFAELPKGGGPGTSISLSKEKVLSILNEYNPIELHRYLLTLSYQLEALNAQMHRISKSRMSIFQQLSKYKLENDDLKFQLEEKNIQLEGTKAKVRVLERMRNEKLCYSTSDLMTAIPKSGTNADCSQLNDSATHSNETLNCPVSDTALLTAEKTVTRVAATTTCKNNEKCADLRVHSDNSRTNKACSKRNVSKIPLKTNSTSKLPTKLASSSFKKLTSFKDIKEYSAPGPPAYSSCVSSTSSSLNNK